MKRTNLHLYFWAILAALAFVLPGQAYEPLRSVAEGEVVQAEFSYGEAKRKVPLKVYLPQDVQPAPVILLSHGLGGSVDGCTYLGQHWSSRGYVVVAMQHAGSDASVWKNAKLGERRKRLVAAASGKSLNDRVADVAATLDQLERWNQDHAKFKARFDLDKVGMSGHSFGAVTSQAVSGQSYGPLGQRSTDKRIRCAMPLSPSPPSYGSADHAFGEVAIPWLLMTGTDDQNPIGRGTAEDRRKVFEGLPSKNMFHELVLYDAQHSAFGDASRLRSRGRNPNHHKAIKAISTAFWDTWLKGDSAAKAWLSDSQQVRAVLEPKDVWQSK